MTIKAIVFDMDDTLYEEKDYVISGFKSVDQWIKARYQVDGFFETASCFFYSGQRERIFNSTLQKLKISYNEELIHELINHYRSHQPDIHLLEDAKWVLNHLVESVKKGLITDGFLKSQEQKVAALRLRDQFQSIILSDKFGREHWKPSYKPYEEVCNELHLLHHECVYVGDNVNKDFVSANRLGWITVQIKRQHALYKDVVMDHEYEAHYQIDNLKKIKDIPLLAHLFVKDEDEYYEREEKNIPFCTAYER